MSKSKVRTIITDFRIAKCLSNVSSRFALVGLRFGLLASFYLCSIMAMSAGARVEPTSGTLGQIFEYTVWADVPVDGIVDFPELFEGTSWTVIVPPVVATVPQDSSTKRVTQSTSVTAFDLGRVEIPAAEISVLSVAGSVKMEMAPRQVVTINSILPQDGETTVALAEVKPVIVGGVTGEESKSGTWIALAIAAAALAIALVAFLTRKKYKARSPVERFRERLEKLNTETRFTDPDPRPFFSELSDAVRIYLATAYPSAGRDLTSEELSETFKRLAEESTSYTERQALGKCNEKSREVLALADRVKFARYLPTKAEFESALGRSSELIAETEYIWKPVDPKLARNRASQVPT